MKASGNSLPKAYSNLVYSINPAFVKTKSGSGAKTPTMHHHSSPPPPTSERPAVGEANADISAPMMVHHRAHVEFDKATGTYRGLSSAFGESIDGIPTGGGGGGGGGGSGGGISSGGSFSTPLATSSSPSSSAASPSSFFGSLFGGSRRDNNSSNTAASSSSAVSSPFNVAHSLHVAVDATAPSGLRGLPPEWEAMLSASGISKAEAAAHPREILDVLNFHIAGPQPHKQRQPPRAASLDRALGESLKTYMRTDIDPHLVYETEGGIKLGEGASGIVRLGVERATGRRVAIKVAPSSDLANLKNETALLAMSEHPDIVSLIATYLWEDKLWIVLEFIHGGSLTEVLGPSIDFPERFIAYVVKRLLSALAFLQGEMRLHRDIKSDNILVDFDGAVKVADFGFAIGLSEEASKRKSV